MKRVVVGMSGGVDSSVTATILKEKGYEVIGVTFKFVENCEVEDAIKVCKKLNIEHHILNYKNEFKKEVIDDFIDKYKNGVTPNPCVMCNRHVKLKFLYDAMKKFNADNIATGHYAKLKDGRLFLSADPKKDQTYFLCETPKYILEKLIFPLEGMDKEHVRELARNFKLDNADKKDSLDVCFIDDKFKDFLNKNIINMPGDIINIDTNEKIGEHKGLALYTIGQRRGLDIGGNTDRLFVSGKDIEKNILYVTLGTNSEHLMSTSCIIENVNWISSLKPTKCNAKFRYHQSDNKVELEYIDDNHILVKYEYGVKSVTPGQACALYINDECLGGGIIKEVIK